MKLSIDRKAAWFSALVALAMTCMQHASAQGPPPTPVRVDAAQAETVQQQRLVTGNLRAVSRSRVAAREPGIVIELPIQAGDHVKRGDLLAKLDDRRLAIQLRQIEAQQRVLESIMTEREAQVALRRSDLEMIQSIEARGAVNPKEVADARLELLAAEARLDQARREVAVTQASADLLRKRMDDMVIRAPFDGVVISRLTELGQWIGEGQSVAEVVAVKAFEVWLNVPQRNAAAVSSTDLRTSVNVEAVEQSYTSIAGTARVVRDVDPMARTFSLVVMIEDKENVLSPGMSVTAWLPTGAMAEHLTIHKDAVLRNEAGAFVYVVRAAGAQQALSATPVSVQVLFDLHDRVAVAAAGLQAGDQVVVEGNERLMPMQPVQIVQAAPAAREASREGN